MRRPRKAVPLAVVRNAEHGGALAEIADGCHAIALDSMARGEACRGSSVSAEAALPSVPAASPSCPACSVAPTATTSVLMSAMSCCVLVAVLIAVGRRDGQHVQNDDPRAFTRSADSGTKWTRAEELAARRAWPTARPPSRASRRFRPPPPPTDPEAQRLVVACAAVLAARELEHRVPRGLLQRGYQLGDAAGEDEQLRQHRDCKLPRGTVVPKSGDGVLRYPRCETHESRERRVQSKLRAKLAVVALLATRVLLRHP